MNYLLPSLYILRGFRNWGNVSAHQRREFGISKIHFPWGVSFSPFFLSLSFGVSHCNHTPRRTKSVYLCVQLISRGAPMACRAPGEAGSLMPHHDSSSNYWLMLFPSSVLATKPCSCCQGKRHCSSLSKILTEKHQDCSLVTTVRRVELRHKSTYRSLQLLEISECDLENCSALKAINDGCVHGKKN